MDGNKDDAQKCLDIGNKALKEGDKVRALRFLSKAQRLDSGLGLEDMLSTLEGETSEKNTECPSSPKHTSRSIPLEPEAGSKDNRNSSPKGYTVEQVEIVGRIRKMKDYYQILGLVKGCSVEEIRKAYRKVSLKVHPDKNKAPAADEAFKAVSKAFACLNDPELRQKYDQYGPEETNDVLQRQGRRQRQRNGFVYEDVFDPDQIFNAFFYGSTYPSNGYHRAPFVRTRADGHQVHTREVHFGGNMNLLQLLLILALFLLSYFPFSSKPAVYSLQQVAPYDMRYYTKVNTVPFFVKSQDFDRDYPPGSHSRRTIEAQIEREYVEILRYHCRQELGHRHWYPSAKVPNCDRLQQMKAY